MPDRTPQVQEKERVRIRRYRIPRFWRRCRCSPLLVAPGLMRLIVEPDCRRHVAGFEQDADDPDA